MALFVNHPPGLFEGTQDCEGAHDRYCSHKLSMQTEAALWVRVVSSSYPLSPEREGMTMIYLINTNWELYFHFTDEKTEVQEG